MRKGLGCGVIAASAIGLGSHAQAQVKPLATAAPPPVQRAPTNDPTNWATVADAAHDAAKLAVQQWQQQATLQGRITAVSLVSTPGQLRGPSLDGTMRAQMIARGVPAFIADKFARVFGDAWKRWQDKYVVPGLPVYPAFAAFPGPQAPPMPNVPFPVGAGTSAELAALSVPALRNALLAQLPEAKSNKAAQQAIDTFAAAASSSFTAWLASCNVMNLMGKGPVPTFAPPYVPVGPVVNGDILQNPGSFMATAFGGPGDAVTTFEAMLGAWKVKLESGKAHQGEGVTSLVGTVSIRRDGWPTSFRLRDAVLTLRAAPPPPSKVAVTKKLAGGPPPPFVSSAGSASVEVTVGDTTLTYPTAGVTFERKPDGSLGFTVDTFAADVCRIQLDSGSGALQNGARLDWNMRCPYETSADADLMLTSAGLSGTGTMRAFGASFGVSYSLDQAQRLMRVRGAWTPASTQWRGIPGLPALEHSVESPKLTFEWTLPTRPTSDPKKDAVPKATFTMTAGKVSVRSAAKRPGGAPWVLVSTPSRSAVFHYDGTVRSPFPALPAPSPEPSAPPLCNVSCDFLKSKNISGTVPPAPPLLSYNGD